MKKIDWFLIINPVAGGGKGKKAWKKIQSLLTKLSISYKSAHTAYEGHAIELSNQAVKEGYRKIVAVGGDGTANEVINGICQHKDIDTSSIVFSIIPIGTGNDWIKTHKIPKNYKKAVYLLKQGKLTTHDIGRVDYHLPNGQAAHRYFINVAGLGYDAYVTQRSQEQSRWKNSSLYYFYLILSSLRNFSPNPSRISFDGQTMEGSFYSTAIGICKYNGGGAQFVPHAIPNDGLFALTTFKNINNVEVVLNTPRFYTGTIDKYHKAFTSNAQHIQIEALEKDKPIYVEVDGEFLGQSPIEFSIQHQAIQILVP